MGNAIGIHRGRMGTGTLAPAETAVGSPARTRATIAVGLTLTGVVLMAAHATVPFAAVRDWLVTYEHGWTRRGLLGTIARQVTGDQVTFEFVAAVGWAVGVLLVAVFSMAIARVSMDERGVSWPHLLLGGTALMSAVGSSAVGASIGRVDHVVMLLAIGAALCRRRPMVAGLLLGVSVLVHPSAILLAVPWVAALRRDDLRAVAIMVGPAVVAFVAQAGVTPPVPQETMLASMQSGTNLQLGDWATWALYQSGSDHLVWSMRWAVTGWRGPAMLGATLLAVLPLAAVAWTMLRRYSVTIPRPMFAAAAAPLLLCAVGIDYGRWVTFAAIATVASAMAALPRDPVRPPRWILAACAAVPFLALVTGPVIFRGFGNLTPMM